MLNLDQKKQMTQLKLTESSREAFQGLNYFIPTEDKALYINALLGVGFDLIDFGSFVSPKAIPQFSDIDALIPMLDTTKTSTELLAIVGNASWAQKALQYDKIQWLGFPFSISVTFQKMNLNRTPDESLETVKELLEMSDKKGKKTRVYLSMAFGNPYGEAYSIDLAAEWVLRLNKLGVNHIVICDTVGAAQPQSITVLFDLMFREFPTTELGFHLHSHNKGIEEKVSAAWQAGCRSFDSVLTGVGGCPLSGYEMVGNLDTLKLFSYFEDNRIATHLNQDALSKATEIAQRIFAEKQP